MIRRDFERIERGIFSTLAPLLRKHLTDPKCNTIELCFLLHAGLVVGGLLRGRVCPWWPLGERGGRGGAQKGGLYLDLGQWARCLSPRKTELGRFFLVSFGHVAFAHVSWP